MRISWLANMCERERFVPGARVTASAAAAIGDPPRFVLGEPQNEPLTRHTRPGISWLGHRRRRAAPGRTPARSSIA